jgi:hypothetical protein
MGEPKVTEQELPIQSTKIMLCTCSHVFQDERYGPNMRVHNLMIKERNKRGWRCTVCGATKPLK